MAGSAKNRTTNQKLLAWVNEMASRTKPSDIHWCDGSKEEYDKLCKTMVEAGTLIPLNEKNAPTVF